MQIFSMLALEHLIFMFLIMHVLIMLRELNKASDDYSSNF